MTGRIPGCLVADGAAARKFVMLAGEGVPAGKGNIDQEDQDAEKESQVRPAALVHRQPCRRGLLALLRGCGRLGIAGPCANYIL